MHIDINDGFLAIDEGNTKKISEFQVGIKLIPPKYWSDALTTQTPGPSCSKDA